MNNPWYYNAFLGLYYRLYFIKGHIITVREYENGRITIQTLTSDYFDMLARGTKVYQHDIWEKQWHKKL